MTDTSHVVYRVGVAADSAAVALLHAESWRRHYRGAYSDVYLDGDIVSDRSEVWVGRMAQPRGDRCTIVAQSDGQLVGFVHTVLDADPLWGALIDNLHVTAGLKRNGIGSALLQEAARFVAGRRPSVGMFLGSSSRTSMPNGSTKHEVVHASGPVSWRHPAEIRHASLVIPPSCATRGRSSPDFLRGKPIAPSGSALDVRTKMTCSRGDPYSTRTGRIPLGL